MDSYSIGELSLAICGIIASVGTLCLIIEKSRCKVIQMPCCKIEREILEETKQRNNLNNP